jgi:hypothetical protein
VAVYRSEPGFHELIGDLDPGVWMKRNAEVACSLINRDVVGKGGTTWRCGLLHDYAGTELEHQAEPLER